MSRFQKPYRAALERHDELFRETEEILARASAEKNKWDAARPQLGTRFGRMLADLWRRELGLRPLRRVGNPLPVLPWRRIDRRLWRLRYKDVGRYRKRLRKLRGMATASWPARRRQIAMLVLELRLWLTPRRGLVVLAVLLLLLFLVLGPSWFPGLFEWEKEVSETPKP